MNQSFARANEQTASKSRSDFVRARAPLRLGFAGGGTDVSPFCDAEGGCVLNATIGLYAYAHIRPREDGQVRFEAADVAQRYEGKAEAVLPVDQGARLHAGVYNRMVRDFNEGRPLPIDVTTTVDVPAGSGLGSSSTLVVALIEAYRKLLRVHMRPHDVASLAFQIEREDLGLTGGKQDQYAATFGGFNFMEFYGDGRVIVNPLRIEPSTLCELEASIVLYYTGQARESARVIESQQRNMRAGTAAALDGLRMMKAEALEIKEALLRHDLGGFAETLNRGWAAKKATASGISTGEIDALINGCFEHHARAAKLSGAGGGGFLLLLADPDKRHLLLDYLRRQPGQIMPCHFHPYGAQGWRDC
jgi:D-glycero-alpha-D-manno-heptose-7-phosphate kinase